MRFKYYRQSNSIADLENGKSYRVVTKDKLSTIEYENTLNVRTAKGNKITLYFNCGVVVCATFDLNGIRI